MKKLIITLLFILSTIIVGYSQQKFEPIPLDKQYHLVGGFATGTVGYIAGYELTKDTKKAFVIGIATSFVAGVLKEVKDSKTHQFDFNDVIYTTAGGVVASASFDLLNVVGRKKEKQIKKLF